jgi:FkbM family methyltransferase
MLPFRELLTMLMPPSVYYRRRIAEEVDAGEPELALLPELVRRGGTAVDVGANQGFFSFALAGIAGQVVAFEPNPDYALFARCMLRGHAEVLRYALSDRSGRATFHVPISKEGMVLHLAGSLKGEFPQVPEIRKYDVEIRSLDGFKLKDVCFIKVDVEGAEREVLDGAKETIARDRPVMVLELLSGTHENPHDLTAAICQDFGYDAFVLKGREKLPALPTIAALGQNSTYNTHLITRNVLFLPR